ncbi:HTH-like domain-containing protein [Roseobacter sp. EG26]|uniref:HTH-like domain-containing protein n=1 Tax=Roseobacter sp. EG26 TaxID=3412477 RepID=UPI003CE5117B
MTEDALIDILRVRYQRSNDIGKVVAIHLFAIEYAKYLQGLSLQRIAESATGKKSYGAELRKGINLAPHVELKDE